MLQGGVTDINSAKAVARKLYMQYCNGGQMERMSMERMLVDTYKVMVNAYSFRIKPINLPATTSISTIKYSTSIVMEESPLMILKLWLSNILPDHKKSKKIVKKILYKKCKRKTAGGQKIV